MGRAGGVWVMGESGIEENVTANPIRQISGALRARPNKEKSTGKKKLKKEDPFVF